MYNDVEKQILEKMKQIKPGTDEYDKCLKELSIISSMHEKEKNAEFERTFKAERFTYEREKDASDRALKEAEIDARYESNAIEMEKNKDSIKYQKVKMIVEVGTTVLVVVGGVAQIVFATEASKNNIIPNVVQKFFKRV